MPIDIEENLNNKQIAVEKLMLSLRQRNGLNFEKWQNLYGFEFDKKQLDFVKKLCDKCEDDLRSQYRPEIFGDSSGYRELMSELGETIEPEDY